MKLLIAIPALNEEQSIRSIIQRSLDAREFIVANSPVTEIAITVVSDGSTDSTVERAKEFEGRIKVIVFPKNRGYGAAIMEAWSHSDADLLSFLDADGTCDPRFFASLCQTLDVQKADIVLGCRINSASKMPPIRRLGNFLFATLLSGLASKTVRDTASGMRVIRRGALRHLYPLPTGLQFTPAMSSRAMLSDSMSIAEIDMPYSEREGRSKLSVLKDGFRFLGVILSTTLLYRPGKILGLLSWLFLLAGSVLMIYPITFYLSSSTVEDWMIYRFLFSSLLAQIAALLWGATAVASRVVEVAIRDEIKQSRRPLFDWVRTPVLFFVCAVAIGISAFLVWPGLVQLIQTSHTDIHWSRFVVALLFVHLAALLIIFRAVDALVDLVDGRLKYLERR